MAEPRGCPWVVEAPHAAAVSCRNAAGSSNDPLRSPQLRLDSFMPRGACAGLSCHLRPWPGRLYLISPGARPKRALGPPGHLGAPGESSGPPRAP